MIPNPIAARPHELMGIYLNDHLAGAVAGSELARRCHRSNAGTRYAAALGDLATAIAEDRSSLERLMARLGVRGNPAKQVSALVVERLARLKANGRLMSYSPLSRVVELDGLSTGVNGKRTLWRSLLAVADHYPVLGRDELERLATRAEEQLDTIERLRNDACRDAFVGT